MSARVCLIAMKATLDRLDAVLSENRPMRYYNSNEKGRQIELVPLEEVKAIRDDLWAAWFELKDNAK